MNRLRLLLLIIPESILYMIFMCMDITGTNAGISSVLKYASILICMIFAASGAIPCMRRGAFPGRKNAGLLLAAALICTAFSDYFLLFEENILPGLISFCVVQTVYLIVICGARVKKAAIILGVRLVLTAIAAVAAVMLAGSDGADPDAIPVIAAAGFYAISFLGNILHLIIDIAGTKDRSCLFARPVMFAAGLILFLLCDVNVLIFNLDGYIDVGSAAFDTVKNASSVLMWAFYLPSQVLIVLSGSCREADRKPA